MFIAFIAVTLALALSVYLLRRRRLANIALLFFSLSLCVTGLETYYRFFHLQSSGLGRPGGANFWERYYRLDPYGLRTSNLPLSKTKDNVVVIGDSHVFGAGLKFPAERFSERLAAHYPERHVINLGLPGWETTDEIAQITKYLEASPARIPLFILTYFFNDIEGDVTPADRERVKPPVLPAEPTIIDHALQRLSRHSRFLELFYYRLGYPRLVRDRLGQIIMFYQDPVIMARHLGTLDQLRSLVDKRHSARLLVVILPYLHSEELLHRDQLYRDFRRALDERGFECLDMQPVFAACGVEQLRANRFDPHTNGFANQLIAGAIISYLERHPEVFDHKRHASVP